MENKEKKKILRAICKIVAYIFSFALLFIGVSCFLEGITKNPDYNIVGINLYVIASPSMASVDESNKEPLQDTRAGFLQVNDVAVVRKAKKDDDLKVGDIVTYIDENGLCVIHRIVSVSDKNGNTYYSLRGDANNVDDPLPLEKSRIKGVFLFRIPAVGEVGLFLKSKYGFACVVLIILIKLCCSYAVIVEEEKKSPLLRT